jgi:ankyrin repeat protein
MVEMLIAHGADLNARADNNQCALDMALMRGHQDIADLLEGLGAKL